MQTLSINLPQDLRAKLQIYQNDQKITAPTDAIVAILNSYLSDWQPSQTTAPLPAMYNAEDGPCEVISSFLDSPERPTHHSSSV